MGNTTTNRAESAHARLKKYLSSSLSDLIINWKSFMTCYSYNIPQYMLRFKRALSYLNIGTKERCCGIG